MLAFPFQTVPFSVLSFQSPVLQCWYCNCKHADKALERPFKSLESRSSYFFREQATVAPVQIEGADQAGQQSQEGESSQAQCPGDVQNDLTDQAVTQGQESETAQTQCDEDASDGTVEPAAPQVQEDEKAQMLCEEDTEKKC